MRKTIAVLLLLFVAVAGAALAHGANSHRLMGTVKSLQDNQLRVTTTDGKEASVQLNAATTYEKDAKAADRSVLVEGVRVSVQLDEDNKTALKIKVGGGGQAQ